MNAEPFLRPELKGARFEGHAIPLEFLKDLAVLEEMIIEVAKWKFLQGHPDRKYVLRGFTDGIELKLTGVEDGSAIPVISLIVAATAMSFLPPANQTYFEQARDAIVCAIDAAEQNRTITDYLPEKTLGYFEQIGRSLRDGEAMEFKTPTHTTPARLTKATRQKLVLASTSVKEITEETTVRGMIPEADQIDMTFEVKTIVDGRKIKAPMSPQQMETVIKAFSGYKSGVRVLLHGMGRFFKSGRLQSFESIENISLLDPLDVLARLEELYNLKNGWLEGKGIAPIPDGLDWFARVFELNFHDDLPLPRVYPMAKGGVQAEWSIKPYEATLEIDLEKRVGEWHCLNLDTNTEETHTLNLDEKQDWEWLADKIQGLTGGVA
jgi:hypothetical protein